MVLVFATERKNNVDPHLGSQKKVNNIQPVFTKLTGVHLMCQIFMNDLLTEQGQQRSRVIGKLSTLLKGLRRIGTKFKLQLGHSDLILKNW